MESYNDSTRGVEVYCKHCNKWVVPYASGYQLEHATLDIVADEGKDGPVSMLDWSSGDIEIDFQYLCPDCENSLFSDLDELDKMLKKGKEARLR